MTQLELFPSCDPEALPQKSQEELDVDAWERAEMDELSFCLAWEAEQKAKASNK